MFPLKSFPFGHVFRVQIVSLKEDLVILGIAYYQPRVPGVRVVADQGVEVDVKKEGGGTGFY